VSLRSPDCAVIGGGIIGLAAARRLAGAGLRVALFERREPGREASWAAAGMLCPRLEDDGESVLLDAGVESLRLYPDFAAALEGETDRSVDLRLDGVLAPGLSGGPKRLLDAARRLEGAALREVEPALAPEVRTALFVGGEGSIDNRALSSALLESCRGRGVEVHNGCRVLEVLAPESRVRGVVTDLGEFSVPIVVNAAGAWSDLVRAPGPPLGVHPVKGQMLLVNASGRKPAAPRHTIYGHDVYVVPRSDGRVIIGTTVEDRGFDKSVDELTVRSLLDRASRLVPGLRGLDPVETWAGLRPKGPVPLPAVGPHGPEGYFVAVGHYRNGILLTPWTEKQLAAAMTLGG
jgi:glycine oxidase